MKKQKSKKKLTKRRTEQLDDTAKFMPETSKDAVGAEEALALTPLAPLGADGHRD